MVNVVEFGSAQLILLIYYKYQKSFHLPLQNNDFIIKTFSKFPQIILNKNHLPLLTDFSIFLFFFSIKLIQNSQNRLREENSSIFVPIYQFH